MKAKRSKNPEATHVAVRRVAQIADTQRRIAEILKAAAAKVRRLEEVMHEHGERIETTVTHEGADAGVIATAIAEHRIRTGDLCSRLVDALERRGQRLYPTPYTPIESPWALVENIH